MFELRRMNENAIEHLYESSLVRDFPASELKSLSAILTLYRRGQYDVLGAYRNETIIAYALVYYPKNDRIVLLDYLAVEPEYRGKGVGTEFLSALRSHYAKYVDVLMIECERPMAAPDEGEARKRILFYTQAGAILTSVRIWLFDVEYSILYMPCTDCIPQYDWAAKMLDLYRQMLPKHLFESKIRLIRR